jgi:hypothetical protein
MKLASWVVLCGVTCGCGKTASDAGKQADAACVAKLKDFEPWFAALKLEVWSYEIDFGAVLQKTSRSPDPLPNTTVDSVRITPTAIDAWDVSQHDHVSSELGGKAPEQAKLVEVLTRYRGMASPPTGYQHGPDDLLRVDVDEKAPWSDVTRVVDAAKTAGYAKLVFAFTATSKVAQPPGVTPTITDAEIVKAAGKKLDELAKTCPAWGRANNHLPEDRVSADVDTKAWAKTVAEGLASCNCAVDTEEIKKLTWQHDRWGQATSRVGVTVALAGDAPATIELPAATPWSEAHTKLLDASPEGAPTAKPVVFVAK